MAALTGKVLFELMYCENDMVPLDYLTGVTQLSLVQVSGEMAEELS